MHDGRTQTQRQPLRVARPRRHATPAGRNEHLRPRRCRRPTPMAGWRRLAASKAVRAEAAAAGLVRARERMCFRRAAGEYYPGQPDPG